VSVDDVNEVDGSTVYLLLEHRKHSFRPCQYPRIAVTETADSLGRVCGVNDHSILGLVIHNQIGVVVTTTLP
jgi:hypothetical protein